MSVSDMSVSDSMAETLKMTIELNPLRESSFYILVCIAKRPIHGYGIIKETESMSNGRVKLSNGTLFGALKRMLEMDWISRNENPELNSREKVVYRITEKGMKVLNAETSRLRSLVNTTKELDLDLKSS